MAKMPKDIASFFGIRESGMPPILEQFLKTLPDNAAKEVWEYLDGTPDSDTDMIEVISESHPELAKKLTGDPAPLAKEVPRDV